MAAELLELQAQDEEAVMTRPDDLRTRAKIRRWYSELIRERGTSSVPYADAL
jgi:hypothetical protein